MVDQEICAQGKQRCPKSESPWPPSYDACAAHEALVDKVTVSHAVGRRGIFEKDGYGGTEDGSVEQGEGKI